MLVGLADLGFFNIALNNFGSVKFGNITSMTDKIPGEHRARTPPEPCALHLCLILA